MVLLTFSTPFCRPREHTNMHSRVTRAIKAVISQGWPIRALNSPATASESKPTKSPLAILTKYSSSHPAMVV